MNLKWLLVLVLALSVMGAVVAVSWWWGGAVLGLSSVAPWLIVGWLLGRQLPAAEPQGDPVYMSCVFALVGGLVLLAASGALYLYGLDVVPVVVVGSCGAAGGLAGLCLRKRDIVQ